MAKKDLDYFHEDSMSNIDITVFYASLPNHLQEMFKKSLSPDIVYLGNFLKGYRGPSNMCSGNSGDSEILSSSNGITEIKFRWGFHIAINIVSLFITMGIQKACEHLEWRSLYFDIHTGECLSHDQNDAAEKLSLKGCQFFQQGKYTQALEYCKNAHLVCKSDYPVKHTFLNNVNRVETELQAIKVNSEGDHFFQLGYYSEAIDKYRRAYNISQRSEHYKIYESNREKAEVELDARNLSLQADTLLEQVRYEEAKNKYQEAYEKSQTRKSEYNFKKNLVENIIDKFTILDKLWTIAWDAENDNENDREEEARKTFQAVFKECQKNVDLFPYDSTLKKYETLVTLKINGNELFNRGLYLQQDGMTLIQAESAKMKFEEAKNYFQEALEKFDIGSKSDERFLTCVELVQEQIKKVNRLIEKRMLNINLSNVQINANDNITHVDVDHCELDKTEKHRVYNQHI